MRFLSFLFALTVLLFFFFPLTQIGNGQYGIVVIPENETYKPGEIVKINATIPQPSNVTFQVKNPSQEIIIVETIITNNSVALFEFQLENDTEEGEYSLYVSAVSKDGKEHASTTGHFNVSKEAEEGGIWIPIIIIAVVGVSGALVAFFRIRH